MLKHVESGTKLKPIWNAILNRCTNPNDSAYKNYGGRGIKVCDRWRESYQNFLADLGPKPSKKHSIDRINNDGHYEPGNVKWATRIQQQNNTRTNKLITYKGKTQSLSMWCRELRLNYKRTWKRTFRNCSIDDVFKRKAFPNHPVKDLIDKH